MSSTNISLEFGKRLHHLRELRNLTQAELGSRAAMSAAAISHFETGQRAPSLESLVKLADALQVSTDALLGRDSTESVGHVDPIFLRASRASAETLDTVRRVTEAILGAAPRR